MKKPKNYKDMPGQYTLEEFNNYLNEFEEELKNGKENFYTHEQVREMMRHW